MNWEVDALTLADARRLDTLWRARCLTEGLTGAAVDASAQFAAHRLVDYDDDRRRGRWILLGAWQDEPILAGYASAVVVPRLDMLLGYVYIDELYVLPDRRRHGAGRALVQSLVDTARRRGAAGVRVAIDPEHAGLEALFADCGFKIDVAGWAVHALH